LIKFISEITNEEIGGKARGLKILKDLGLNVPDAFIILHPRLDKLDEIKLKHSISRLGNGNKAVRSSAVSEDGETASFAGQFESFLNLTGYQDITDAIGKCITAAQADRVQNYASNLRENADLRISVILQNMVQAKVAGVVFSADPVTNRRDKVIINVVEGSGESLVSGRKDAVHYELFKSGSNIQQQISKQGSLLTFYQLEEILDGAKIAEAQFQKPVDLEWAIDDQGIIHWLQVRPITTLREVHYNELDTVKEPVPHVWTLGNIGEMMPGVVTPLTYSVSFYAIDYGMAILANAAGARSLRKHEKYRYIQMFYNRLFFNMTNMMDYPNNVWMNKSENVQLSICGIVIPSLQTNFESPLILRVYHFFKQLKKLSWTRKSVRRLRELANHYTIDVSGNIAESYLELAHAREVLKEVFGCHLLASAQSGSLYSAMMGILTGNKRLPNSRDHHIATILLGDIKNIESADAVNSLERFVVLINSIPGFPAIFAAACPEEALNLLIKDGPPEITKEFANFLQRHGHRCIRESELREKTWKDDPIQLIQILQTCVKSKSHSHTSQDNKQMVSKILKNVSPIKRLILKSMLAPSREAVSRRENTKAASIKFLDKVRKGYRHLGQQLVNEGFLDDPDQVFFLTHEELGKLISDKSASWKTKASSRRKQLPETDRLIFSDLCYGLPEPLEEEKVIEAVDGQLKGIPVSNGVIEAKARIVQTIEEAGQLKPGEIMVASFTDIGWTPYFSIIAGLVTEIGSPLSHGAVVAREYGIPAVVGVKGAKQFLKNGDLIRLDGDRGIVEKIVR
jgi:rifampicin phosphotransferase